MAQKTAENILNYTADNKLIMPDSATLDPKNRNLVRLFFEKTIEQKQLYHLNLKNISDLSGNTSDTTVSFVYYEPLPYEVIMDEIYPDPSHSNGLPPFEYAEIKNIAPYPINIGGWKFCNHTRCTDLPMFMLQPDNYLILCDTKADSAFASFGKFINTKSFPALNNNADTLKLLDKSNKVIHEVIYDKKAYQDKSKSGGGWSLEMKNTRIPCLGNSNWTASINPLGGTPGKENSVKEEDSAPIYFLSLQYVEVLDSMNIIAYFNLPPDHYAASQPGNYLINNNTILTSLPGNPRLNTVSLRLSSPLEKGKVYSLKVQNLSGCAQIVTGIDDRVRFGIPESAGNFDVVINEILFHPRKGSKEFVELYNHSTKIIDVRSLQLANRNKENKIASVKDISSAPAYLFPNEFLVITENKNDLMQQYFCKTPSSISEVASLPSYPNKEGTVVLLTNNEKVIDEVHYSENVHFDLFHNQEGVSLERINDQGESNDPGNWHSASSVSGYATPTYQNSQSQVDEIINGAFNVNPKVFSPDNDGID
ncbi:MAG: lamin tail domain-containing protein, partial [Chitinophagaceae bacterium]